jgi:hypothetical protein
MDTPASFGAASCARAVLGNKAARPRIKISRLIDHSFAFKEQFKESVLAR